MLDDYTWRTNARSCSTAEIHGYSFTMAQQGLGIKLLDLCPACDQQLAATSGGVRQGPGRDQAASPNRHGPKREKHMQICMRCLQGREAHGWILAGLEPAIFGSEDERLIH